MIEPKAVKLHLGCADNILEGWINIDASSEFHPDVVHDLAKPLPFDDMSADEVMAIDLLEHFDKYQRYFVFCDWTRVLKVGGKIALQVPDFKKIVLKYKKFKFNDFAETVFGENLIRSKYYVGHYGNHKWGYSVETLKEFAGTFGIKAVEIKIEGLNISFIGEKERHVSIESLKDLMIHSHANSFGGGIPDVELGVIREKIVNFFNL